MKEPVMKTTAPCGQAPTMCLWRPVHVKARMDATLHQATSLFPPQLTLLAPLWPFFSVFLFSDMAYLNTSGLLTSVFIKSNISYLE